LIWPTDSPGVEVKNRSSITANDARIAYHIVLEPDVVLNPVTSRTSEMSAFRTLTMICVRGRDVGPHWIGVWFSRATPSPIGVGARPRTAISHPDSDHCRIQITNPDMTAVNPSPPPSTRLWNT
jgi:hypothetical protein